jgi:hypothetical protein
MNLNVAKELAGLKRMGVNDLRTKFAEVFGEATPAGNKDWLVKRIIWRMQALAEGDLSERARRRAAELANDADLRLMPPRPKPTQERTKTVAWKSGHLPPPGSAITRVYKGETLEVKVLAEGFEFEGEVYKSLSAVAKKITGSHCSGNLFFGLKQNGGGK